MREVKWIVSERRARRVVYIMKEIRTFTRFVRQRQPLTSTQILCPQLVSSLPANDLTKYCRFYQSTRPSERWLATAADLRVHSMHPLTVNSKLMNNSYKDNLNSVKHKKEKKASRVYQGCFGPLTSDQLFWYAVQCAMPMVGFGIMDNTIMIQAGDLIDTTIGVKFGFATLTAAAAGQVFSDASGVLFGGAVEAAAKRLGLPPHDLSEKQIQNDKLVRMVRVGASVLGVILGCCIGMTQLFFMDLKKAERLRAQTHTRPLFSALMTEGHELLDCERCALYLISPEGKEGADLGEKVLWQAGIPDAKKSPTDTELQRAFCRIDEDQDGVIKATEDLPRVMRKLGYGASMGYAASREEVERVIKENICAEAWQKNEIRFEDFRKVFPVLMNLLNADSKVLVKDRPLLMEALKPENLGRCLNIPNVDLYKTPEGRTYSQSEERAVDLYKGYRTKSLLICPIMAKVGEDHRKEPIGVIEVANKRSEAYLQLKSEKKLKKQQGGDVEPGSEAESAGLSHSAKSDSTKEEESSDAMKASEDGSSIVRTSTRTWLNERFVSFAQSDEKIVKVLCMHAAGTARSCGLIEEEEEEEC